MVGPITSTVMTSMLVKKSLRRLFLASVSIGVASTIIQINCPQANASGSDQILPLESRQAEISSEAAELSTVASDVNTEFADEQARQAALATEGVLQFEDIPIIGDLFTSSGELSMTSSLPVSVSVGSVMNSYGVVVKKDMDMTLMGTSPSTIAPIER